MDRTGIYYDATCPSDLETLLESTGWETPELMESAARALEDIKCHCLSKYNHAPLASHNLLGDGSKPRVLVIDQTFGDSSVSLGLADTDSFIRMLEEARTRFPEGRIFVKTHPDVLAGKKKATSRKRPSSVEPNSSPKTLPLFLCSRRPTPYSA